MTNPKIHTLNNGLTAIIYDTKSFPTLTTMLLVGSGSRYEDSKNNGIAHFFEHMVFKGSKKYPDSHAISSTIDGLGGVFNAFTSKDHTGYWIKAPNNHFETVIDVLSDMVLNPLLLKEEIERERGVITEEINMYEDTPSRKVEEILENILYPDNPLGFDIIGTKETVSRINKKMFDDYIGRLYIPNNSVFVIAGGLDNSHNYLEKIEQKFGHWTKSKKPTFPIVTKNQSSPNVKIKHKKTEQAHFCLAYRGYSSFDKRKYALTLLAAILGGGMSSRLFSEVRERRGLCYYISSQRESYYDCGSIVTQAGVVNNKEKIEEAVKVILEEQGKIVNGDISDEEIERAKEMIKGRILLSLESSNSIASYYGVKKILEGVVLEPKSLINKLEAVTKLEIIEVAREVFKKDKASFALIGPFQQGDFSDLF
jgi:predicted Zn-dependent peptidase